MSAATCRGGKGPGSASGCQDQRLLGPGRKLEYVDEAEPEDIIFENHGVKVLIDPKSLAYIDGDSAGLCARGAQRGLSLQQPERT